MPLLYFFIFLFGLCIGSFLNVVVYRLKNNKKIVGDRSRCPHCDYILKWYENIPLLSFIFLQGKCSQCKNKISWQYPIVELTTSIFFLLSFLLTMEQWNNGEFVSLLHCFIVLIFYWVVISFLILIFLFDLKYYLIPDKISLPAIIVILLLQLILLIISVPNFLISNFLISFSLLIFSAIIISGFFYFQYIVSQGKWIGGGDIRLGFLIGLILGWPLGIVALFLSYILGLIFCLPLLILGKKNMKSQIPFGTFLTTSTLLTMFFGEKILKYVL